MTLTISIVTLLFVFLTLLPLSRHAHWLVRSLDFPRLQLALVGFVLLIAQGSLIPAGLLQSGLMIVTLLCFGWQLWWILPYTRLWPVEVKSAPQTGEERHLSIMTANVLTPNRKAHKLIDLVHQHQPDVLVTLESDRWWEAQLDVLEADMPHTIKCPQDNLYGMHVYSRLPILEHSVNFIVEDDIPSMHALIQLRCGDPVRFHFIHPAPPSPTENPESAERDAELVIIARSIAKNDNGPTVVTGDLNDVAWSPTTRLFRKLSGLLDPRIGRGMFNTFHADYAVLRWPLDHIFHSTHFTVNSILRLPHIGSDHFSLLTRLTYSPHHGTDQEGLKADQDDTAWADDIADEQDVDHTDVPQPGADHR